jgi:F0F1-type ATP synthase membrane subunit b/b'
MSPKRFFAAVFALSIGLAGVAHATEPSVAQGHHEEGHDEAKAHEGEHEGPPAEMNWADFSNKKQPPYAALALNFLALVAIYYFGFRNSVTQGLKDRKKSIAKDIESAQGMLKEAKDRAKRYQAKLGSVDEDSEQAKAALTSAGEGEKAAIEREAAEKVERMKRDADFLVTQETKQLSEDLLRETVESATAEAEAMLAKGITQADQERLAQEFLDSLAKQFETKTAGGAS